MVFRLALAFLAALIAAPAALYDAGARLGRFVWDLFVPLANDLRLDLDVSDDRLCAAGGSPVDPAIQQELRHEAGMKRVAAARNT